MVPIRVNMHFVLQPLDDVWFFAMRPRISFAIVFVALRTGVRAREGIGSLRFGPRQTAGSAAPILRNLVRFEVFHLLRPTFARVERRPRTMGAIRCSVFGFV